MNLRNTADKLLTVAFTPGDVVRIVTRPEKLWVVMSVHGWPEGHVYLREQGWNKPELSPGSCSHHTTINPRLCQRVMSASEGETSTKGTSCSESS